MMHYLSKPPQNCIALLVMNHCEKNGSIVACTFIKLSKIHDHFLYITLDRGACHNFLSQIIYIWHVDVLQNSMLQNALVASSIFTNKINMQQTTYPHISLQN